MDKLLETIGTLHQKKETGAGGVLTTLLLVVLSLVAVAAMMFAAWQDKKALAKLRHERDVAKEDAHRAASKAAIENIEAARTAYIEEANLQLERVDSLRDDIYELSAEHERKTELISKLKTWDDINEYLEDRKSSISS